MVRLMFLFATATLLLCSPTSVKADVITSLFNTGVNGSGTPLPDGTIGDPHYTLIQVPGGTTDIRVTTSASGFPIGPWIGDSTTSAWIGPNNDSDLNGPVGVYVYRTTFDLTGFDPLTAFISGGWSTDNDGIKILINGVDTGNPPTNFAQFSIGYAPFSISTGFVSGINTIDFYLNNGGGPTGLRVDIDIKTADILGTSVPEPASMTMFGFGVVSILAFRLRRSRK